MALSQMHKDYRIRAGESRSTTTEENVLRFEIHQEGVTRLTSLRNAGGDWRWELIDDEGAVVVSGAGYQSKAACREVVEAIKATNSTTPVVSRP